MQVWTLEKTVEVQFATEIDCFRIEAYRTDIPGRFRMRTFQYGLFRLHPTFDAHPEGGADHYLPTVDHLFDSEEVECASADEAVQYAVKKLKQQLLP